MNEPKDIKALEKSEKQQRTIIKTLVNRVKMQFAFKNITTFGQLYLATHGGNTEYVNANYDTSTFANPISKDDIAKWEKKLFDELEQRLVKARNEFAGVVVAPVETTTAVIGSAVHTQQDKAPTPAPSEVVKEVLDEVESKDDASNNYGLLPSPKETAYLFYFQAKAAKEILDKLVVEKKPAVLLIASTGTGKTFIDAAVTRRLVDMNFTAGKCFGITPILSVTRSTVVEQTRRVNRRFFGLEHPTDCEVINIEQLRSRAGQMWLEHQKVIVNGEEETIWKWKPFISPAVIKLDECQSVKNEDSTQHQNIVAYSELPNTSQLFISATPFARVSEAKAFAIATKKDISHLGFPPGTRLSSGTWRSFAGIISGKSAPEEYNEAAVERLMKELDDYIVRVKGVRWQFNARNHAEVIDFQSDEARAEYSAAWEKYLIKKAKLEESVTDNPRFQAMIELMMFLTAAEYCKRDVFAKKMYENVKNGYASVLGIKNKKTVIAVVKILVEKYGVSRDDISLIWGGGQTMLTAKQKLKNQLNTPEAIAALQAAGISMEDLALEEVEARTLEDLPEHLRLGAQSREQRQHEIDKFQSGRSKYCIFTEQAGGVGLSLHHSDEYTTRWNENVEGFQEFVKAVEKYNKHNKYQVTPGKVRRKPNGYAYEEDIKFIPVRARRTTIGPTWSPMGLVQKVGRVPRLTSLSDTDQEFLYYRGTVEEQQAFVVTHRLRCLSKVVKQRESWNDIITNHERAKEIALGFVESTEKDETDEPQHEFNLDVEEEGE